MSKSFKALALVIAALLAVATFAPTAEAAERSYRTKFSATQMDYLRLARDTFQRQA
jgi:hypothetical protein